MLRISQTYAQIGIQTQNDRLQLHTTQPKLNIHQEHVQVELESELPRVRIDQYQCFAEAGLKNNIDLLKEAAQLAQQQSMQYTAEIASDGDRLAAIENNGDAIVEIAERDAYPEKEFNIDTIPKSRPKIEVIGNLEISFKPGGVQYNAVPGKVENNTNPGQVNIYMRQWPSIIFQYIGKNVDTRI
ncbi:MAG: hypothetical protein PWQ70_1870 [Clostridiales bacterium]|nr:hypothetical protein [Clostridiales bacterium]